MNKNNYLKIGLMIAFEEFPYAGVVRPLINWAKEFEKKGKIMTLSYIKLVMKCLIISIN